MNKNNIYNRTHKVFMNRCQKYNNNKYNNIKTNHNFNTIYNNNNNTLCTVPNNSCTAVILPVPTQAHSSPRTTTVPLATIIRLLTLSLTTSILQTAKKTALIQPIIIITLEITIHHSCLSTSYILNNNNNQYTNKNNNNNNNKYINKINKSCTLLLFTNMPVKSGLRTCSNVKQGRMATCNNNCRITHSTYHILTLTKHTTTLVVIGKPTILKMMMHSTKSTTIKYIYILYILILLY